MEFKEGTIFSDSPRKNGDSFYFLLSEEFKAYFGLEPGDDFEVHVKMDVNKRKERFAGIWLEKKKGEKK